MSETWQLINSGLQLKPEAFQKASTAEGLQYLLVLFALAVISKSLGEVGILYINRASRAQYLRGLVGSLAALAFSALVWSTCIWCSLRFALGMNPDYRVVVIIVGVSYSPLVFSFLDIIPHVGLFLFKIWSVWGLLITVAGLHYRFGLSPLQGLACSGVGWVLFYSLNSVFGGAAEKVRLRLLGRDKWVNPQEAAVALLEREMSR
ncbi:MAG: hypothetical protein WC314_19260 [Vulcanimicrobiota bacterium]